MASARFAPAGPVSDDIVIEYALLAGLKHDGTSSARASPTATSPTSAAAHAAAPAHVRRDCDGLGTERCSLHLPSSDGDGRGLDQGSIRRPLTRR